jgi:RNA polymerase sigma factor (sigma-70 family)
MGNWNERQWFEIPWRIPWVGSDMLPDVSATDMELIARYTRERAEDAFAELVQRHLGLVYSAALRQVRSPQLAEEVAQSVFIDFARNAARLKPDTILTAWLYQVTRRTAIDVVRREASRQMREQIAMQMNATNATADDWTHIEPLLDEAMHALDETDRTAVLLRYFENKSLREVGATLGASENAAQKRLARAIERLREFFAKRGVTAGASGLIVGISANAVQAAPVGLAVTISTAAALGGTAIAASTTATATKVIAMTTLQKTLITVTLTAAVSAGIYEAHNAAMLRTQVRDFHQQQATLAAENQQLSQERDDAVREITAARDASSVELAQARANNTELQRLRDEVGQLRQQVASFGAGRINAGPVPQAVAAAVQNRAEEMRQLGLAASRGDLAALQKLDELSQIAVKGRTNENQDTHYEIRIAFKVIGEAAGKGSETAFQALWQSTRMDYLSGMAMYALGDAAAMGNEKALEVLLDPKRYLLKSSPTGPLVAAAKNGNVRAIEYLATVANNPKKQAEWHMATDGLKNSAAAGNATAIDALTVIGSSQQEAIRAAALRALESAALNNQARAVEALRGLGYK